MCRLQMVTLGAKHRIQPVTGFLGSLIDPIDRLSETIFSILVFLTFTLAFKIFWITDALEQPISSEIVDELLIGALGHVLVAIIAVIISFIPLLALRHDHNLAIRISIFVSFIVLFVSGFRWGTYTGANPWKTGLVLMSVAAGLVIIAILLGG